MKKSAPRLNTAVRPIIYSLLAAFPLLAVNTASAQFADTPLHLQQQTTISGGAGKVKPNVMLFIDDSGSMADTPDGRKPRRGERSRIEITQNALNTVINKYGNKINWGLQTLHNNNGANFTNYTDQPNRILQNVNKLQPKNGTPTTRRYYEISQTVMENTLYRCQKNYIVLMSDGDANLSCGNLYKNFEYQPDDYFGYPNYRGSCEYSYESFGYYDTFWDRNT